VQEFNLSGSTERLDWVTGLYYYHDSVVQPDFGQNGVTVSSDRAQTKAGAAYVDGTYSITDRLKLTLGTRYSVEKRSIQIYSGILGPQTADLHKTFYAFTPRAALRY